MRRRLLFWLVAALLIIKIAYSAYLFYSLGGYTLIDGDDCSMVVRGWQTVTKSLVAFDSEMWLPMHPLLLALGFKLYPHTLITPFLINTLFSVASEILLFLLCFELLGNSRIVLPVAVLTALGAMFHPLHSRYNISGFEMPIFSFFIISGVYCWVKYENNLKKYFLLIAGFAFLLATATRYEGWIFNALFSLMLLKECFQKRRQDYKTIVKTLGISYLFIAAWLWWEKIFFGDPLYFLWHRHKLESNIATPWNIRRFTFWAVFIDALWTVIKEFYWPFFVFLILGIVLVLWQPKTRRKITGYVFFVLGGWLIFLVLPALRLDGFEPAKRFGIIFLLFLPLANFGLCQLVVLPFKKKTLSLRLWLSGRYFVPGYFIRRFTGEENIILMCH